MLGITTITTIASVFFIYRDYIRSVKQVKKAESWMYSLRGFHSSLENGANKNEAEIIRRNIASTLHDVETHLRESAYYRKKEITIKKHEKVINSL